MKKDDARKKKRKRMKEKVPQGPSRKTDGRGGNFRYFEEAALAWRGEKRGPGGRRLLKEKGESSGGRERKKKRRCFVSSREKGRARPSAQKRPVGGKGVMYLRYQKGGQGEAGPSVPPRRAKNLGGGLGLFPLIHQEMVRWGEGGKKGGSRFNKGRKHRQKERKRYR